MLDFSKIQQKISKYKEDGNSLNEENTKMTLVAPFIRELGFDVFDIDDVVYEYTSDMRENGNEKVDYAIMLDSQPKIFIEVKALGTKLAKYIGQLKRYYVSSKTVNWGILTDGNTYMFFNDSDTSNIMDDEPFYTLRVSELCDKDLELLSLFVKNKLSEDVKIDSFRVNTKLTKFLSDCILRPDEDFLEYINGRIGERLSKAQYISILGDVLKSELLDSSYVLDDKCIKNGSCIEDKNKYIENGIRGGRGVKIRKYMETPKTFEAFGITYKFTSWRDMLVKTLNLVINLDKETYLFVKEELKSSQCLIYSCADDFRAYYTDTSNKGILDILSKSDDFIMSANAGLINGDRLYCCASGETLKKWSEFVVESIDLGYALKLSY